MASVKCSILYPDFGQVPRVLGQLEAPVNWGKCQKSYCRGLSCLFQIEKNNKEIKYQGTESNCGLRTKFDNV